LAKATKAKATKVKTEKTRLFEIKSKNAIFQEIRGVKNQKNEFAL
jgi:hypothetical protein